MSHPGSEKKDVQILVDTRLNIKEQCTLASNKASSILEWIRRIVASRLKEVIFPLSLVLVRAPCPVLVNSVQERNVHFGDGV